MQNYVNNSTKTHTYVNKNADMVDIKIRKIKVKVTKKFMDT